MPDPDYLDAMYAAGAGAYFDILSANAFGFDLPPEDPPDAGVLNFRRVELQRQIMERYGDGEKAVWFNEYGWNAAPETFDEEQLTWKRVSEEEQAEFTLRGIEFASASGRGPGCSMCGISARRPAIHPNDAAYYFRMVDVDMIPRRVYDAVRDAAQANLIAGPGHLRRPTPPSPPSPAGGGASRAGQRPRSGPER